MSVIVKGMKMPLCCGDCPLCYDNMECEFVGDLHNIWEGRHVNCPLIAISISHGRLIDENDLTLCEYDLNEYHWFRAVPEETLQGAPTILEAED